MAALDENPFCTRRIRPGAIPFVYPAGESAATVADRFQTAGRRGAIVGPHGSGKSSLLVELVDEFRRRGQDVLSIQLHDGQRHLPANARWDSIDSGAVVIVDGYEQLGWPARLRLRWRCLRRRCGLLLTSHRPTGLPQLVERRPTLDEARAVIARLLPPTIAPPTAELATLFRTHDGNLREVLLGLYDWFERTGGTENGSG